MLIVFAQDGQNEARYSYFLAEGGHVCELFPKYEEDEWEGASRLYPIPFSGGDVFAFIGKKFSPGVLFGAIPLCRTENGNIVPPSFVQRWKEEKIKTQAGHIAQYELQKANSLFESVVALMKKEDALMDRLKEAIEYDEDERERGRLEKLIGSAKDMRAGLHAKAVEAKARAYLFLNEYARAMGYESAEEAIRDLDEKGELHEQI